jgi:hypothetical protein
VEQSWPGTHSRFRHREAWLGFAPPSDTWVVKVFGPIEPAPIFTVDSGRPVNPRTEIDTFGTHSYPLSARPAGVLEDRAADLVAWAFNLFNRANVAQINPVFGAGAVLR